MEKIYHVSFFKRLVDSNGRPVDACQGAVEVRAAGHDSAIEIARKQFAQLKDVVDWSLRADYEKVELLEARTSLETSNAKVSGRTVRKSARLRIAPSIAASLRLLHQK